MKSINLNQSIKLTFGLMVLALLSCKKEHLLENKSITTPEGYAALSFNVEIETTNNWNTNSIDHINSLEDDDNNYATSNTLTNTHISKIFSNEHFDYRIIYEEPKSNQIKTKTAQNTINNKAAVLMQNGIKYIVFIYNLNDSLITQKTLTAGGTSATSDNTIILPGGSKYKYKAISYNTTTAPTVTIINDEPVVQSGNNDLIYAEGITSQLPFNTQGALTPNPTPFKTGILFKHQTARLELEFDFGGLGGFFTASSAPHDINLSISSTQNSDVNPFTTGQFNVFTGEYIATSHSTYPVAFNYISDESNPTLTSNTQWQNFNSTYQNFNSRMRTFIYTSRNITIPELYLRIKKYKFYKSTTANTENTELNASESNPVILKYSKAINLEIEKSKKIIYQPLEPAVTVPSPTLAGVKFARADLRHRGANTNMSYRISTHITSANLLSFTRESGFYLRWRFNELKPERFSMYAFQSGNTLLPAFLPSSEVPSVDKGDPCSRIYPQNLWKSPTVEQLTNLAAYINNNLGTTDDKVRAINGSHILFPQATTVLTKISTLDHNRLILMRSGYAEYIENSTPLSASYVERFNFTDANLDSHAYYWSNERGKYLLIKGLGTDVTASVETLASTDTERTMHIRCVRAE